MNVDYMISVIIPVYNVEAYVAECIESIINQTYQNLQIIIVDDESQDNSSQICEEYAQRDSRILFIKQAHSGVSKARNNALQVSKGDYITFVDADDWLELNAYESMLDDMVSHKVEVVFCGYYKEFGKKKYKVAPSYQGYCNKEEMLRQTLGQGSYLAMACTKMFNRKLIFQQNVPVLFDETLTNGEDGLWTWTVLAGANNAYLNNARLYHYRIRDDGANFNKIITVNKLSELTAYKKAYNILSSVSSDLLDRLKAITYNSAHELRIKSYIQNNKECEQICVAAMNDTAKFFYRSSYSIVYKIHHLVINLLIKIHLPRKVLKVINSIIFKICDLVKR